MPRKRLQFEQLLDVGYAQGAVVCPVDGIDEICVKVALDSGAASTTATVDIETTIDGTAWDTAGYVSSTDGTFTTSACSAKAVPFVLRRLPVFDVQAVRVKINATHTAGIFLRVSIYGEGEYGSRNTNIAPTVGAAVSPYSGGSAYGGGSDMDMGGGGASPDVAYTGEITGKE